MANVLSGDQATLAIAKVFFFQLWPNLMVVWCVIVPVVAVFHRHKNEQGSVIMSLMSKGSTRLWNHRSTHIMRPICEWSTQSSCFRFMVSQDVTRFLCNSGLLLYCLVNIQFFLKVLKISYYWILYNLQCTYIYSIMCNACTKNMLLQNLG
jgi:hypothetical protein